MKKKEQLIVELNRICKDSEVLDLFAERKLTKNNWKRLKQLKVIVNGYVNLSLLSEL